MLRIITPEPVASSTSSYLEQETWRTEVPGDDFEIVVGKRQIASLLFVGVVVVAVSSGLAYVAGKAAGARDTPVPPPQAAAVPVATQYTEIELFDLPGPAAAALSIPSKNGSEPSTDPTLFTGVTTGGRYLQVASVDRGAAAVLTQGLRQRGFKAIAAPGAQQDVYRVLVGPFENTGESQGARAAIAGIGTVASTPQATP